MISQFLSSWCHYIFGKPGPLQPLPSRFTPSPTQSCLESLLNKPTEDRLKEATKSLRDESESLIKLYSLSKSKKSVEEDQPPYTVKEEDESIGNSSIEGSIISYDEVIEVTHPPPKKNSLPICNKLAVQSNTLSSPEPYEGWDALLTELRASGLIRRDGNEQPAKRMMSRHRVVPMGGFI